MNLGISDPRDERARHAVPLLRKNGGGSDGRRFVGLSGNRDCALMFPVPDAFAGALPEATALPENDDELGKQERCEDRLRTKMFHPDVHAYGEDNPGDQTYPKI